VRRLRARGETVGIAAVDPSSRRSGGALLGDRARVRSGAHDPGVFLRSMAARERLGGLADATWASVTVLAAVFDHVFVETVGVGQSEAEVADLADTLLFVAQPGAGDVLQFMKAGVLEHPDVFAVNKADLGPVAERTASELATGLALAARDAAGWTPPPRAAGLGARRPRHRRAAGRAAATRTSDTWMRRSASEGADGGAGACREALVVAALRAPLRQLRHCARAARRGGRRCAPGCAAPVVSARPDRASGELRVRLTARAPVPPGSFGTWDLPGFRRPRRAPNVIETRAADDLAGVAAILAVLEVVDRIDPARRVDVRALLTRAEEVGFVGAIAAARGRTVPAGARIVAIEASKAFPHAPQGAGPILRVGSGFALVLALGQEIEAALRAPTAEAGGAGRS
jgi:hypothetical protein